jgi:hypothetical protein
MYAFAIADLTLLPSPIITPKSVNNPYGIREGVRTVCNLTAAVLVASDARVAVQWA